MTIDTWSANHYIIKPWFVNPRSSCIKGALAMENGTHRQDVSTIKGRMFLSSSTMIGVSCALVLSLVLFSGCEDRTATNSSQMTSSTAPPTTLVHQTDSRPTTNMDVSPEVKLESAPVLDGAERMISELDGLSRIIYRALADNPYGLAEGQIIGEYKYEVFVGEQRTGGVALAAPAVSHYLEKALAALPADQAHWLLPLPVDISDCRTIDPILIDRSAKPIIERPYYIRISSSEELGIVNILDARQQVVIDEFKMFGMHYVISEISNESDHIIEGEEMAFLFVIARFQAAPPMARDYTFGDRIGTTQGPVLAGLTSVRGPFLEHHYDCILSIEGCPVFVMANRK